MRIATRLAVAFLIVSLVPLLITSWTVYRQAEESLHEQTADQLRGVARNRVERIEAILEQNRKRLDRLTSRTQITLGLIAQEERPSDENRARLERLLTDAREISPVLDELSILDPAGRVIASTRRDHVGQDRSGSEAFRLGRDAPVSHLVARTDDGRFVFLLAGPILLAERLLGVLVVEARAEDLLDVASDHTDLGETGETVLVRRTPDGDASYLTPLRFEAGAAFTKVPDDPRIAASLQPGADFQPVQRMRDYREHEVLAASAAVSPPDWGMIVKIDVEEALSDVLALRSVLAWAVVGSIGAVLAASFLFGRAIARPILDLTRTVVEVGRVDPAVEREPRGDEIVRLTHAFERMTENLARSREVLQQERDRAQLYFHLAGALFVVIGRDGRVSIVNQTAARLLGRPIEEIVGRPWFDEFVPPRDRETVRDIFRSLLDGRGEESTRHEDRILTAGGEERIIAWTDTGIRGEDGLVVSTISSGLDVTERKRAEEIRDRLAGIVEASDDAIYSVAPDGTILSWNRGAEKVFGWKAEEAVGEPTSILVPPEGQAEHEELLGALARGEHVEALDAVRSRKNGERIDVALTASPIRDPEGRLVAISAISRDITQEKLAESRFRLAVEASPSGMVMVDREGRIVLVNSQTERTFGYDRSELVGRPVEILVPERYRGAHAGFRGAFLAAPESRPMGEGRDLFGLAADGREIPVEIGLSPIESREGTYVLAAIVDITDRKRMEDDLRRSNAELEEFASAASHDMQEPLRKISTFADLLASRYRGKIDEKADHYIEVMVDAAGRMRDLIQDLLTYSKVGRTELEREPTDLAAVLAEVLDDLRLETQESRAAIEVGPLPVVSANPKLVYLLLKNLISNALKYSGGAPPHVEVSSRTSDGTWIVSVRDHGIGIDPRYLEKIFEAFQRLHTRREYPGTGIGLAVCRKIVQRHGGRIWAESTPGKGSTFSFSLPRSATGPTQPHGSGSETGTTGQSPR